MATNQITCCVTWSARKTRAEWLDTDLGKAHGVYAITAKTPSGRAVIRIGASADLVGRLRAYPVLDLIPEAEVSWSPVSDEFLRELEPVLQGHFGSHPSDLPRHLVGKSVDYCVQRELGSAEYKVERLLLEAYVAKHECLPPGNPRTGSARPYLKEIRVIEDGALRVLDMSCAELPTIEVRGAQLIRLLW